MSEEEKTSEVNYDWLTEALFEKIIEKELTDCPRTDYEIRLTSIKPAVGKGDNYVSEVTRVELEVTFVTKLGLCSLMCNSRKPKTYNFIIKSSKPMPKEMARMNVFEKEIGFYEEVAHKFQQIDDTIPFLPKYHAITTPDRQIIILDDLAATGFKMQDRMVGLDLEHCKMFYKTIAQFHALSATCYEKFGRFADRFHESLYRLENKEMNKKYSDILFTEYLKIFDRYECLKPFREKLHKWKDGAFEAICEIVSEKSDEFNVLNHGDGWLNNMLFRNDDDNKPTGLCFVDFQLSVYGTPMTDILYFFVSSPTLEVRERHFDELLHVYHTHLSEYLKKYNYPKPIPTMRDLQMRMLKDGLLGPYFLQGVTAVILISPEDSRSTDFFFKQNDEADTFRYNLYNSPRFIKAAEAALTFFDRRGLLEF